MSEIISNADLQITTPLEEVTTEGGDQTLQRDRLSFDDLSLLTAVFRLGQANLDFMIRASG